MQEFKLGYSEQIEDISKSCHFFSDLSDIIRQVAKDLDLDSEIVEALAAEVTILTVELYRSNNIYVPKKPLALLKQLKIFNKMRQGIPVSQIAHDHDVSEQWVYQVYKDMQKKHIEKVQNNLF